MPVKIEVVTAAVWAIIPHDTPMLLIFPTVCWLFPADFITTTTLSANHLFLNPDGIQLSSGWLSGKTIGGLTAVE